MTNEPIMQYFAFQGIPEPEGGIRRSFYHLATKIDTLLPKGAERSTALRKLLESLDAALRASLAMPRSQYPDVVVNADVTVGAGGRDPISGQPLPAGSPYSQAHAPITQPLPPAPVNYGLAPLKGPEGGIVPVRMPAPGQDFQQEMDRVAAHINAPFEAGGVAAQADPSTGLDIEPDYAERVDVIQDWIPPLTPGQLGSWTDKYRESARNWAVPMHGLISWSKRHHGDLMPPRGVTRIVTRPNGQVLGVTEHGVVLSVRDDT